jgi:predicted ATPase
LNVEPSSETTALRDRIMQELTGAPSPSAALTNLPNPLTSFIGREKELKELRELLAKSRLLTLTGAGGSGKTRLVIEVARAAAGDFKHGAWWVDLADVRDEALVPREVLKALGISDVPNQTDTETLTRYLITKQLLLVIDNCEHLIAACARLAETLLNACTGLKILATSREALNLAGETVYQVPTLIAPVPLATAAELMRYESVRLFVARAKGVKTDFALTEQNASAISQICTRLDGIPLALELAAARVKLLSVEHIAARLDDRFKLLTGGSRTALPRQQTLRATIDWSYDLLPEPAQRLFRRLSVFVGGFTLEAAEQVCSDGQLPRERVLDELGRLVDRSLVLVELGGEETRYRMLETIREYANEKLVEHGELEATRDSHLRYFVEYGKRAGKKLELWDQQLAWFANVGTEFDNIRSAFKRGLESNLDLALELLWSIRVYWFNARVVILPDWQIQALPQAENWDSPKRARIIVGAGEILLRKQPERGRGLMQRGLQVALDSGDSWEIGFASYILGRRTRVRGDLPAAHTLLRQSVTHFREVGDEWMLCWAMGELAWAVASTDRTSARRLVEEMDSIAQKLKERRLLGWGLNGLGDFERLEGNYPKAAWYFEESIRMKQDLSLWRGKRRATELANLAHTFLSAGDYTRAMQLTLESLESARGDDEFYLIFPLGVFPRLLLARQQYAKAARLFSAEGVLTDLVGARWNYNTADYAQFEHDVAEVRAYLDAQVFDAAWAEGKKMTMDEAIEFALANLK